MPANAARTEESSCGADERTASGRSVQPRRSTSCATAASVTAPTTSPGRRPRLAAAAITKPSGTGTPSCAMTPELPALAAGDGRAAFGGLRPVERRAFTSAPSWPAAPRRRRTVPPSASNSSSSAFSSSASQRNNAHKYPCCSSAASCAACRSSRSSCDFCPAATSLPDRRSMPLRASAEVREAIAHVVRQVRAARRSHPACRCGEKVASRAAKPRRARAARATRWRQRPVRRGTGAPAAPPSPESGCAACPWRHRPARQSAPSSRRRSLQCSELARTQRRPDGRASARLRSRRPGSAVVSISVMAIE